MTKGEQSMQGEGSKQRSHAGHLNPKAECKQSNSDIWCSSIGLVISLEVQSPEPQTCLLHWIKNEHISMVDLWPLMENWAQVMNSHKKNLKILKLKILLLAGLRVLSMILQQSKDWSVEITYWTSHCFLLLFPATCSWSIKDTRFFYYSFFYVTWKHPIFLYMFFNWFRCVCGSLGKPMECCCDRIFGNKRRKIWICSACNILWHF